MWGGIAAVKMKIKWYFDLSVYLILSGIKEFNAMTQLN